MNRKEFVNKLIWQMSAALALVVGLWALGYAIYRAFQLIAVSG